MRNKTHSNAYQRISEVLDALEQDAHLCDEDNFIARIKALESLELLEFDDIEQVNRAELISAQPLTLEQRAQVLKQKLDNANEKLFTRLVTSIRSHDHLTFRQYLRNLQRQLSTTRDEAYVGYDEIDSLVWGLLEVNLIPQGPEELEPEMVYYQPSSTRTVLRLINELQTSADDIFYDLGSGLGHVPILVNLLTDIKTKGVEIQEFYYRYANECLNKLALPDVEFINADARYVDYEDGTIFYLYTPFRGEVLRHVLEKLEEQSKRRRIQICTFGPCTSEVAEQDWLQPIYLTGKNEGALAIFSSV